MKHETDIYYQILIFYNEKISITSTFQSSRRENLVIPPTSHTTVRTVRYTAVQST